jgi:predicted Zn-dependent peptidase
LIEKVTLKEVNALARRLLDPKKLSIVVVGDPKGVKNGL